MGSTWTQLFNHIVFGTKLQRDFISPELEERLYPFIGGIVKDLGCTLYDINGTWCHLPVSGNVSLSQPVELELAMRMRSAGALLGWRRANWGVLSPPSGGFGDGVAANPGFRSLEDSLTSPGAGDRRPLRGLGEAEKVRAAEE